MTNGKESSSCNKPYIGLKISIEKLHETMVQHINKCKKTCRFIKEFIVSEFVIIIDECNEINKIYKNIAVDLEKSFVDIEKENFKKVLEFLDELKNNTCIYTNYKMCIPLYETCCGHGEIKNKLEPYLKEIPEILRNSFSMIRLDIPITALNK